MTTSLARPPILSRPLLLWFVASFSATTSFYLLLSVVPMYATSIGAGGLGAGLTTAALMFATVAAEFVTPRLLARFGYRAVVVAGLILLGAPAFGLIASLGMAGILLVCVVRGLGFAIMVVAGGALVATLVPPARRAEGLGLSGVVVGVPAVLALPLGVWLAGQVGYPAVFVAGAVTSLVALLVTPGLPGRAPVSDKPAGMLAGLRDPNLARPALVFFAITVAGGVVVSFVPLAVTGSGGLAALALLVHAAAATAARYWAGRTGDRRGSARLLVPSVVLAALGMLAMVLTTSPVAVLAGMVLFGTGFGVAQNATISLMFQRVSPSDYGTVSAVWNLAYDAGYGVGAAGFGALSGQTGYPAAFGITGVLMLIAIQPARRTRR